MGSSTYSVLPVTPVPVTKHRVGGQEIMYDVVLLAMATNQPGHEPWLTLRIILGLTMVPAIPRCRMCEIVKM